MFQKPHIPDTSGFNKNTRFRCIPKKNTSELQKIRQSRCILTFQTPQKYPKLIKNTRNSSKIPQIYQFKQPALPHTKSSKRISAQIIVRLTRAGVYCEGEQVYSREIIVKDIKSAQIIVKDIKSPRIKVKYIKNAKPNSKTQKQKQKTIIAKKLKFPY